MCLKEHMTIQIKDAVHCYRKKTAKQFINFLKRVDRRHDDKNIQNIFVALDNLSVHKSKRV